MMNWQNVCAVFSVILFVTPSVAHKPSDDARFCALATTLSHQDRLDQAFQGGGGYDCIAHQTDKTLGLVMLHFRHGERKESLLLFQATNPHSAPQSLRDLAFLYGLKDEVNDYFHSITAELVGEGGYDRLAAFYDTLFPGQSGLGHLNNRATAFYHTLTQSSFMQNVHEIMGLTDHQPIHPALLNELKDHSRRRIMEVCQWASDFCLNVQHTYPNDQIQVMGHHLGGFVAQYVAAFLNLSGCSFGAPGAAELYRDVFGHMPDENENKRFICYQRTTDVITKLGTPMGTVVDIEVVDGLAKGSQKLFERTQIHNDIEQYAEELEPFEDHPLERVRITPTRARSEDELPVYIGAQHRSSPKPPAGSPPPDVVPASGFLYRTTSCRDIGSMVMARPNSAASLNDDDDGDPDPQQELRAPDAGPQPSLFSQQGFVQRLLFPQVAGLWQTRFSHLITHRSPPENVRPSSEITPGLGAEVIDNPGYIEE